MGKVMDFIKEKKDLKLAIMDYECFEIDSVDLSLGYARQHWDVFQRLSDREIKVFNEEMKREFVDRLYSFIFTPKISEMLVILYLLDKDNISPNIYELNKLLKRNLPQYPATLKAIQKLVKLDILCLESDNAGRNKKKIMFNKNQVKIYGDDEFRRLQLDNWSDAKSYTEWKLRLIEQGKIHIQSILN